MIPSVRVERILSRTLFEVAFEDPSNISTAKAEVCRELFRLLPPMLTSHASSSTTPAAIDAMFVWHENNQQGHSGILEIRDTRAAAFCCDILEQKRVIRLACRAQVSWFVGGGSNNDDDENAEDGAGSGGGFPLPDATTRSEEELRMNVDAEMWSQAEARRSDVVRWLDLHAPQDKSHNSNSKNQSSPLSFERILAALGKATSLLSSGGHASDPFRDDLFVGAFNNSKNGAPGLLTSLLPILNDSEVQPTAKQLVNVISHSPNVYARALCLIYVRYRCGPENIVAFFSNPVPRKSSNANDNSSNSSSSLFLAPSVFSALGKPFASFAQSPLLDTSAIQVSAASGGGATTTSAMMMKDLARMLLLEDELLEMWLPTYSAGAVSRLQDWIEAVKAAAGAEKKQTTADGSAAATAANTSSSSARPFQQGASRRGREGDEGDSSNTQQKATSTFSSGGTALLPGIHSVTQLLALVSEQAKQGQRAAEAEKQRQAKEDAALRRQFAEAAGDLAQTRALQQRQAAALKDRRRREVLERLQTAAAVNARAHELEGSNSNNYTVASGGDARGGGGNNGEVVNPGLVARGASYFASFPPPYAALPPLLNTTATTTALNSHYHPVSALCSTTTVGVDDVFVCF